MAVGTTRRQGSSLKMDIPETGIALSGLFVWCFVARRTTLGRAQGAGCVVGKRPTAWVESFVCATREGAGGGW